MLPKDRTTHYFSRGGDKPRKGIDCRLVGALSMALLFALFESFLAGCGEGTKFIWVYKWWGVIPVFVTTYIPFFLASNYINDFKPKTQKIMLASLWGLVALLLVILIPCGVI